MLESFQRPASGEQQFAYGILRAFLGVCFWTHAFLLLFFGNGLQAVVNHMLFAMAETHLPQNLILLFGYGMPFLDFVLGGMLILGVATLPAICLAYAYLCLLLVNFTLDTDWPSVAIALATGGALALLMVGRSRFDRPWHDLLFRRHPKP